MTVIKHSDGESEIYINGESKMHSDRETDMNNDWEGYIHSVMG